MRGIAFSFAVKTNFFGRRRKQCPCFLNGKCCPIKTKGVFNEKNHIDYNLYDSFIKLFRVRRYERFDLGVCVRIDL